MAIVTVLNQKGGSGKTTLAINLAHALQRDGETVLLVDADPQGSARDWHEANGGEVLHVVGLDRETLARDLKVVGEYDWVLIDGAPQIAKLSAVAVKVADLVLIPDQLSPFDVWACADLVEMIDPLPGQALGLLRRVQGHQKYQIERGGCRGLARLWLTCIQSRDNPARRVSHHCEGATVLATFPDEIEAIKDELKGVLQC